MMIYILTEILLIIAAAFISIYPHIDNYQDRRKNGFWKKLKPPGKVLFVVALGYILLQFFQYNYQSCKDYSQNKMIDSLQQIILVNDQPRLTICNLAKGLKGFDVCIENSGRRGAKNLKLRLHNTYIESENALSQMIFCELSDSIFQEEFVIPANKELSVSQVLTFTDSITLFQNKKAYFHIGLTYTDELTNYIDSCEAYIIWDPHNPSIKGAHMNAKDIKGLENVQR